MIRFTSSPVLQDPATTQLVFGADLSDALACFGPQDDCIGCSTTVATTLQTTDVVVEQVRQTLSPLARPGLVLRPDARSAALLHRGSYWTKIDIDAKAQRLRSVRLPAALVDTQRLLALNDVRGNAERRPIVAIGMWALFAHPVVRSAARLAGARDGLTAEIALGVHPDRYVLIDHAPKLGCTVLVTTADIVAADLIVLALRAGRNGPGDVGPWEDPLVQAATELGMGARFATEIDIEVRLSPTLTSQRQAQATAALVQAAERIGIASDR